MPGHSRQCKTVQVGRDVAAGEGVTAISLLDESMAEWAKPREVFTGYEAQYHAVRGGKSQFDSRLEELGIKLILAAVGTPNTTGKIERWFGTYDREAWRFETLDDFLFYYNQVRPHQSLDYEKPMDVFLGNLLPFH